MKKLYLLRHAKSSWDHFGIIDYDRPLNDRGQRQAEAMGQFFQANNFQIDLILCSGALRTRETLELLLDHYDYQGEIEYQDEIYASSPSILEDLIDQADVETLLLIGHNPEIELLASSLSGEHLTMKTCQLAVIDMEQGRLELFTQPEES